MTIKIGVAIPCYQGHIERLFDLLKSIKSQTILPDKVVVSCSSTTSFFYKEEEYNFPLEVIPIGEHKNAAQNRNIAASKLNDMDYITFIDADDVMHNQRIEILLKTINEYNSDIILHNFFLNDNNNSEEELKKKIENICVRHNSLTQHWSGCITHISHSDHDDKIHHSQVTTKTDIFNKIKFPEEVEYNRKEDCVFCYRVFSLPNITNTYILNKLSYYAPSNTIF
jgi:glycosyltransferase involved in cell wall biosynthesis